MIEVILQYIATHWGAWLFAAISGILGAAYRRLSKQLKTEQIKARSINAAVLALLHDRLYQACQFYISRGYCTVGDRDNLEYMFKPYKALGGNGTGEELYNRCLALEYGPAERED
jgi:hypothetical protein